MRFHTIAAAVAAASSCSVYAPLVLAQESVGAPVVVTATRMAQRADEVMASVEVIDREMIERSGQSSLVDVLQSLSGIRISSSGGTGSNASVFLRGAESRHTLLLVDGLRVGSATSGQPTLEAIPLAMIERIEVLRGPASALYGSEALGGVIQIFTRRGIKGFYPEVAIGYGTYDTLNASVSLRGGVEKLSYSVTAGQDDTEGHNAKHDPAYWASPWGSSYHPDKDGFRNRYFAASATLEMRERDRVGVSVFATDGRNDYDTNDYYESYLDKRVSSVGAYMINQLAEGWTSTLRVGESRDKLYDHPDASGGSRIGSSQKQFQWQHDVQLPVGTLMAAYEHTRTEITGNTDYTMDQRHVNALLLGWSARFDAHNVQINVRRDDNSQFGSKTTGMFAYGYRINPTLSVHGSVATAFNAPTFNQLYWPETGFGSGSPDLKPEQALNRELGLRWDDGMHHVELTYYNNRVRDLISGWPPQNLDNARLEGLELAYEVGLGAYNLRAGADFLNAKDEDTRNELQRRARIAGFVRVDKSAGAWNWGVEWNGLGRRYEDTANKVRLPGYGIVNAYAHYALARDWRLEVRANNILDKSYEVSRGYATAGANVFVGVRYAPR